MNKSFAAGLRALADWYELHPDMPRPWGAANVYAFDSKEEAARVVRALGTCRKQQENNLLRIERDFGGGVILAFVFSREAMCERVVVGTEEVPEQTIPAHTLEIVEWKCSEPILAEEESA